MKNTKINIKDDGSNSFCIDCKAPVKLDARGGWITWSSPIDIQQGSCSPDFQPVPGEVHRGCSIITQYQPMTCNTVNLEFQMADMDASQANMEVTEVVGTDSTKFGAIVQNVTAAVTTVSGIERPLGLSPQLANSAGDSTDVDIKLYLSKPIVYKNGNFTNTDTSSTFTEWDVLDPLFSNTLFSNKLTGVFSIRATAVYTLQVNANRFQQGRYFLAHVPSGGYATNTTRGGQWLRSHTWSRTNISQLPHVEVDLAKTTEVTLKIPFVSWMNAAPLRTTAQTVPTFGSPGWVNIFPYKSLMVAAGGSTTASWTIWVHYENIELFGNVGPQCGDIEFQMADAMKEIKTEGPVESSLKLTSRIAGYLQSYIPYGSTIKWVADVGAGLAHTLGWSAPRLVRPDTRARLVQYSSFPNVDGAKAVTVLAASESNVIDPTPGFAGTSQDELSIDFLKNIYAFVNEADFEVGDAAGLMLWSNAVTPTLMFGAANDSSVTDCIMATPVFFLSQLFAYYRGSLTYRFKFVMTEFHSGRVMIVVNPIDENRAASGVPAWNTDANYVHKTILDLRTANEFEVNVPFVSNTSWKSCGDDPVMLGLTTPTTSIPYAYIYMYVLTPLMVTPTVSGTVPFLVEIKGGPDLEFAMPRQCHLAPVIPANITNQCADIEFQVGDVTVGQVDTGHIGTASVGSHIAHSASCMGESIQSLRQLIKRPYNWFAIPNQQWYSCVPQAWQMSVSNGTTMTVTGNSDLVSVLSSMFVLRRGSIRLFPILTSPDLNMLYSSYLPYSTGFTTYTNYRLGNATNPWPTSYNYTMNGALVTMSRNDWGVSVEVPMYATTHSQSTIAMMSNNTTAYVFGKNGGPTGVVAFFQDSASKAGFMFRAGGDDISYGGWAGIPCMRYTTGNPT